MQTPNRISNIFRETDESRKENLLIDLHNEIVFSGGVPLNDHERDDVYRLICAHQESLMLLIIFWRLALKSQCHPALEQYARAIAEHREDTAVNLPSRHAEAHALHNTYRHYAVAYLHLHNAPYFVQHMEQLSQERDPYILYEVACEIGKSSVSQKITMLIDMVGTLTSHELYEAVSMDILYEGTVEHLAMLREKMNTHPEKRHVYQYFAELVELGLREDGMKANAQHNNV
jgi:hypothetical protein